MIENGNRDIVHVVYEPGAFTPLLRLSATIKGAWKAQPYFMVQAAIAGLPAHKKNDDDVWGNLQAMQNALERMAPNISRQLDANMRRIVREEPEGNILTGMGQHLDGIMTVGDVRKALKEKQRKANITVLYFHCDHIGTPLALLDQRKKIVWAARRDPWGNLQEQYNPSGIIQPIGLPGQHYDRETGLYYNGHRYYDARIGAYINQDPIGILGGLNLYGYVFQNPISGIDPLGLWSLGDPLPQGVVDFSAGFGDSVSFGITSGIRELLGTNDVVNFSSSMYTAGVVSGTAVTAVGYGTGAELKIGKNFRLAPWGNRTDNSLGECPHYHRRGNPDENGDAAPGQGINRHRPWEKRSPDTSFWDRF